MSFFADVRVYRRPDHHYEIVNVEVPAPDLPTALSVLQAWIAGLASNPAFDTAFEESLYATKRRGSEYMTLREAAQRLQNHF